MEFNPFTPEFKANPYPSYAELRGEGPVYHAAAFGIYIVSHYEQVVEVLKNPGVFSSTQGVNIQVRGETRTTVINADPPIHTRLRNLVNRAFTPRLVAAMEPRIREITTALLDRVAANGKTDLVADLAVPLPVTVIAEMLGIEPERHEDFKRWSTSAVSGDPATSPEEQARISRDLDELVAYFEGVIAERRNTLRDDLVSALVMAESGDDPLQPEDVVAFCILLLIAGNETTTNLIGNAVIALLEHPDQLQLVRREPGLIPNLVEEALRYDSPVQFLPRRAIEDVELGGVFLAKGAEVFPAFASANRDERKFPEPDRFDVTRNAQGHVAFGHGIHFCLGAPLARLEASISLGEVIERLPDLERADDAALERVPSPFLRGVAHLPLVFESCSASSPIGHAR